MFQETQIIFENEYKEGCDDFYDILTPESYQSNNDINTEDSNYNALKDIQQKYIDYEYQNQDEIIKSYYIPRIDNKQSNQSSIKTIVSFEDEEVTDEEKGETSTDNSGYLEEVEKGDVEPWRSNLHEIFPIPTDPDIEKSFWNISPPDIIYNEDGIQKFMDLAKTMGLMPISNLKKQFLTDKIDLRYYGIDSRIVKILCDALEDNTSVKSLNLKNNLLCIDACFHLNELLQHNFILTSLNLSGCRIGPNGMKRLEKGLVRTFSLEYLNLSSCNLGTEGLHYLSNVIQFNLHLKNLDLANNNLQKECAEDLHSMLIFNRYLEKLDLSWNSLFDERTTRLLFKGLVKNISIRDLNLSWNALGSECITHLCWFLTHSAILQRLNLSNNRFTEVEAEQIAMVLSKNSILSELYLQNNPLKPRGALMLIKALTLENSPQSGLHLVDLNNVWANKDIIQYLTSIEISKPFLIVKLGGIFENFKLNGPNAKRIFLKRANFEAMNTKKKKQRKNFAHFVLSLEEIKVKKEDFQESVQRYKLPISDSLVNEIFNAFAVGQFVNQGDLKKFYLQEYPNAELPSLPIISQKRSKIKKKQKRKEKRKKIRNVIFDEEKPKEVEQDISIEEMPEIEDSIEWTDFQYDWYLYDNTASHDIQILK